MLPKVPAVHLGLGFLQGGWRKDSLIHPGQADEISDGGHEVSQALQALPAAEVSTNVVARAILAHDVGHDVEQRADLLLTLLHRRQVRWLRVRLWAVVMVRLVSSLQRRLGPLASHSQTHPVLRNINRGQQCTSAYIYKTPGS